MNDTPRTDSESYNDPTPGYEVVSAYFARSLERELAAMTEQRDRLAAAIHKHKDTFQLTPDCHICDEELYKALQSLNEPLA